MGIFAEIRSIFRYSKHSRAARVLIWTAVPAVVFVLVVLSYIMLTRPFSLWGMEFNKSRIKHDTIVRISHDTIYITRWKTVPNNNPSLSSKQNINGNTKVTSHHQSGGQTANQINNTY